MTREEVEGMLADLDFMVHPDEVPDWVVDELDGLLAMDVGDAVMAGMQEQKLRDFGVGVERRVTGDGYIIGRVGPRWWSDC